MTEDHVRDAAHPHVAALRQALEGELAQRLHIGDEHVLADLERHVTQVLGVRDALTMTDMIVRANGETLLAEEGGKALVALHALGHAMHDLDKPTGRLAPRGDLVGLPHEGAHRGGVVAAGIGDGRGLHRVLSGSGMVSWRVRASRSLYPK